MSDGDDHDLLAQYARGARDRAEAAFAALAERHLNLVYSTALRSVGNAHAAEEISQAVFIILANKADKLPRATVLSGWLYHTTRLTAANFLRCEIRRQKREQEAFMHSSLNESANETWTRIAPVLDDALAKLGARDRDAIVLRFFENKSLREVGAALGASEDAAKMRVNRALEKLRKMFARRGATFSAAAIAGAISTNSVHAAPAGLAKMISAVAMTKGAAASGSTLTLVKGALKIMAWTKAKTAIVVGVIAVLTATTTVVVKKVFYRNSWVDDPSYWRLNNPPLTSYPPVFILRPTHFSGHGGGIVNNDRFLEKDTTIQDLIATAYGFRDTRIVFPEDLPQGHPRPGYDLMLTLPSHPRQVLRDAIQKRFGLVGHTETIMTNVLLVRVANPNAPGLKLASLAAGQQPGWFGANWSLTIRDQPLDNFLGGYIESQVRQPVLNETGLAGHYDLHIQWHPQAGETDKSAFERALGEQLGLELVPTNMPIEMLIVEKAN
jgi:uncharacterized protein (TIGR03435 family)